MLDRLKLYLKNRKYLKMINKIPYNGLHKLNKVISKNWESISEMQVKCSYDELKKLLPIEGLCYLTSVSNGLIEVKYDKNQFNEYKKQVTNSKCIRFINQFKKLNKEKQLSILDYHKDTILLIVDVINSNNSTIIISSKMDEIGEYLLNEIAYLDIETKLELEDRIEFELEFIRKRK